MSTSAKNALLLTTTENDLRCAAVVARDPHANSSLPKVDTRRCPGLRRQRDCGFVSLSLGSGREMYASRRGDARMRMLFAEVVGTKVGTRSNGTWS
jgi:hypothetical protein